MKLIKTYDSEIKAEVDKSILINCGIEAVTMGSDSSTVGDSLRKEVKLFIMNESDESKARSILNGAVAESAPIQLEIPERYDYVNIANIFIRVSAVFFMIYGLDYLSYIAEGMTYIDGEGIGFDSAYRVRVIWDCVRIIFHVVGGLILIYYSDSMAKAICFDFRREHSPKG